MTKDKDKKTVVPPLRFPEFRDADGWKETTLGAISSITNGKANAQDHIEGGKYPLFDRSDVIKSTDNYLFDCEAVIIPGEGVRFIPKYYVGKFNLHQRAYALKDFSCIGSYVYYFMEHNSDLLSIKAVKSTVLSLRLPILQNFPICTPISTTEQQKIADCLGSLDDLTSAVADKIEVLKEHKKGLMQQLFPAEGKTIPALRFSEFRESGEWLSNKIGKVCKIGNGRDYKHLNIGETPVYGSGGRMTYVDDYLYEGESVCIGRKGTINKPIFLTGKFWTVDTLFYTHSFHKCLPKFLYLIFQQINWYKYNEAGGVPSLSKTTIGNIDIYIPRDIAEQQKIADCFSSVDNLISAETDKLEQLKAHKKGLMQQLFPPTNK